MVNAEVKEKVFNKDLNIDYRGCYADLNQSSCNKMIPKDIPIKYSEVYKKYIYKYTLRTIIFIFNWILLGVLLFL